MKTKMIYMALFIVLGSASAHAEDTYSINLNRMVGKIDCTFLNPKGNNPEFDCSLAVKGSKMFAMSMKKAPQFGDHGKFNGFFGADVYNRDGVQKTFVVISDENKSVKHVHFMDVSMKQETELWASSTGSSTTTVHAASVNPLHISANKEMTEVKMSFWFNMYSQDSKTLTMMNDGVIPEELMNQVQPHLIQFLAR